MVVEPHLFFPQGTNDINANWINVEPGECYCYNIYIPEDHPTGMHISCACTELLNGRFSLSLSYPHESSILRVQALIGGTRKFARDTVFFFLQYPESLLISYRIL